MKKWVLFATGLSIVLIATMALQHSYLEDNDLIPDNIVENKEFNWYTDFNSAISAAGNTNQNIFAVFTADWCVACRKLDSESLSNFNVQQKLSQNYINLKINIDTNPQLSRKYGIFTIPTLLILDSNGGELERLEGYQSPNQLLEFL